MTENEKDSLQEILKVLVENANVSSITIRLKPKTSKESKQTDSES
mgnify:CR=1|nr:MAG TPA: hypothetical protein [Caudoviricetes sp.]